MELIDHGQSLLVTYVKQLGIQEYFKLEFGSFFWLKEVPKVWSTTQLAAS